MRATVMHAAGDVRIENVPDAHLIEPTDALLTITRACICGSDLWPYKKMERSEKGQRMGHEFIGLCGVIAARRLGAERIIMLGRHADRIALAKDFGATDIVSERGEAAIEKVHELTKGVGAHSVLECVGLEDSMRTALSIARPGGAVGRVGVPQDETMPASRPAFYNNVTLSGGPAPARAYIEELLPDVLEGRIEPGRVFERGVRLNEVPGGYRALDERDATK